jgi:hypothetical protein
MSDDDITIPTSNDMSAPHNSARSYKSPAIEHIANSEIAGVGFRLATDNAIADSGATQIFVMDGTPVVNKQPTTQPLKVSLANIRQVMSTHMCDIHINGLPFILTGHIIPDLSIASLFGKRVLTKAGCVVTFTCDKCIVCHKNNIILQGEKDPATKLDASIGITRLELPAHQARTTIDGPCYCQRPCPFCHAKCLFHTHHEEQGQ